MYLKITNAQEIHHGLQYFDGLNIDPVPFAAEGSCCRGGIYFTTPEYIWKFLYIGQYIREVTIPKDAEMVMDPSGDKWRASKVFLWARKDLNNVETWKWLEENGVDIHNCSFLINASLEGYLEVVKYLVESGSDIHAKDDCALRSAAFIGHLEVVKYLVEAGSDIHAYEDYSLRYASEGGHLEVVKYLVTKGANINACNGVVDGRVGQDMMKC